VFEYHAFYQQLGHHKLAFSKKKKKKKGIDRNFQEANP
jgi:hypothetical protein